MSINTVFLVIEINLHKSISWILLQVENTVTVVCVREYFMEMHHEHSNRVLRLRAKNICYQPQNHDIAAYEILNTCSIDYLRHHTTLHPHRRRSK